MGKINKYLSYLIPVILISVILYGYLRLKSYDIGKSDLSLAITNNNILFVETPDFFALMDQLREVDGIWDELKIIPEIQITDSLINGLLSLSKKEEKIKLLLHGKIIFSLNINSDNTLSSVLISRQTTRGQSNSLFSCLQKMQGVNNISKQKIDGNYIYEVHLNKSLAIKPFYYAFKKGLIISSFSMQQVEEALKILNNQENKNPLSFYTEIRAVISDNLNTNLYLNFYAFDKLINKLTLNEEFNTSLFAESAGFDFNIQQNGLSLNGFIVTNERTNSGLRIIANQKPSPSGLIEAIPGSAASFILMNITDPNAYFNSQSKHQSWKPDKIKLNEIENKYSISLQEFIKNNIKDEFGLVILENRKKPSFFFIAEVNSGSITEARLKEYLQKWASVNKTDPAANYNYVEIDKQSEIPIYKLPLGGIPQMIFGNIFREVKNDFFSIYDNYLIFGNSAGEIADFVYQLMLGQTFSESEKYKNITDNLLTRSNLFFYADPLKVFNLFSGKLKKQTIDFYNNTEILKKFNALTLQSNYSDDLYYARIFINYSDIISEQVNNIWQSKLDTVLIIKPAIVINHLTSGKEILVQDASNQLYLLSNAGRILWKIHLDGPIMSEIYQIDYYRNKKLQYLFNTKNKIYIIDRNGNPLDNYPLALRSPATNGIALFDYDLDGNIRICVACENRRIYMYNREGKIVPGWNPVPTDHILHKPLQHFKVSGKDYLVAADIHKTYIYDRQGNIRVNLSKQYPVSVNNPFWLDSSQGAAKAKLVNTDTLGNIINIYLTGNTSIEKRETLKSSHFFIMSDLNNNKKYEYIFISDSTLIVTDVSGKTLFRENLGSEITYKPIIFEFSNNDKKIGIVVDQEEKIYLFNNDGSIYNGFPLKGSTLFSISSFPGLKGRFNLIVGNNDNFLYNYVVQ